MEHQARKKEQVRDRITDVSMRVKNLLTLLQKCGPIQMKVFSCMPIFFTNCTNINIKRPQNDFSKHHHTSIYFLTYILSPLHCCWSAQCDIGSHLGLQNVWQGAQRAKYSGKLFGHHLQNWKKLKSPFFTPHWNCVTEALIFFLHNFCLRWLALAWNALALCGAPFLIEKAFLSLAHFLGTCEKHSDCKKCPTHV